jgi:hypothetical protein
MPSGRYAKFKKEKKKASLWKRNIPESDLKALIAEIQEALDEEEAG